MAAGNYDAEGIWQHGEDDAYATFSERLNKGQTSISAAFQAFKASLRTQGVTGGQGGTPWVAVPVADGNWSTANTWGYRPLSVKRVGRLVVMEGQIRRTTGNIGNGNIGGTVPAGYRPPMRTILGHVMTGGVAPVELSVQPNGQIRFDLTSTLPAGTAVLVSASWVID